MKTSIKVLIAALAAASLLVSQPTQATTAQQAAKVSFTFDDGLTSSSTLAAPILAKYGLSGTNYVITNCVGMTTIPNKCLADGSRSYMTWDQIMTLQNSYGWEIGSHTADHKCLASNRAIDPDNCQKNSLTKTQIDNQLSLSKTALAAHGINATAFSAPYGDYNNVVLAEVAKFYSSMRGFKEAGVNGFAYNDYLLHNVAIQQGVTTVESVKASIDEAIAHKSWLVLTFHDISDTPSADPYEYQYGSAELEQIAAYVKSKQEVATIQPTNVSAGLVTGEVNLLPNGSFDQGIAAGWTTDAPSQIKKNTANHGSYPSPTNSAEFTSTTKNIHLFSPKVSIEAGQAYVLKSFLNVEKNTGGSFSYYIDEYDANGNWVSGQYKVSENSSFVESINIEYKPSSVRVAQASLQMIVTANSGIHAYVDNVQWYSQGLVIAPPPPPVPVVNLMPNGDFGAGLSSGWATDAPSTITADGGRIKLVSGAVNTHLFSPRISVTASTSYTVDTLLDLQTISNGVLAIYIDEYDAGGNWISGKYILEKNSISNGTVSFSYTPTSAAVAKASVQYIVVGNAGITAYLDNVVFSAQ